MKQLSRGPLPDAVISLLAARLRTTTRQKLALDSKIQPGTLRRALLGLPLNVSTQRKVMAFLEGMVTK